MEKTAIGLVAADTQSAVERGPSSHPSLEDLEDYHAGKLDPGVHERIVDHLTQCRDCTILLLYGVIETGANGQELAIPEFHREQAWGRLRRWLPTAHERRRTLDDMLSEETRLPLTQAIDLAAAITRALARFHARGRVLSDLRPENIVVEPGGKVQFLDFGLAPTAETLEVGYGPPPEMRWSTSTDFSRRSKWCAKR